MKGLTACDKLNDSNPNATGTMTITTDSSGAGAQFKKGGTT